MKINVPGTAVSRAVTLALLVGSCAVQTQAGESGDDDLQEVVVSGSRVITNGFSAPNPITVLTAEQMQMTAPTSISDAINQLPQFRASYTPATTGFAATANAGNGGAFANLRGLNPKRVLVLLNSQRVVQSQANGGIAGVETFLTINNLFDKQPPEELGAFFGVGVAPTNYTLYDAIGRMFTLGARVRF